MLDRAAITTPGISSSDDLPRDTTAWAGLASTAQVMFQVHGHWILRSPRARAPLIGTL